LNRAKLNTRFIKGQLDEIFPFSFFWGYFTYMRSEALWLWSLKGSVAGRMKDKYSKINLWTFSSNRRIRRARQKFLTMAGDFWRLKGQCHEIFASGFFRESVSPKPRVSRSWKSRDTVPLKLEGYCKEDRTFAFLSNTYI
jgi:hypothetical protein